MTDPASLPNFPPPPDQHPLRGRVLDALIDVGIQPNVDDDGDVAFKVNDQQLFIRSSEGDLTIMRVFGQWQLPEELRSDTARIMEVCNELNLTLNCIKTGIGAGSLVVTADFLETTGLDVPMATQLGIQLVLSTVHLWHQKALGINPDDPAGGAGDGSGS